jgi:hypothetical protein
VSSAIREILPQAASPLLKGCAANSKVGS